MKFDNYSIRPLQPTDLQLYFQLVENNRARLSNFFTGTVAKTKTLESTKIFLDENLKKTEAKTYFSFIVIDDTNNTFAGFLDIKNIDWTVPKAELGCYIDEKYANKGISSKALATFTNYCFANFEFKKLFLRTHQTNSSARRIAEKCGFEIEGTLRRDYKTTSGELVDLIYYGKLAD
ncbi:MAG TPA: GNAT family protein [Bacteroidia bacterium]|nr:GNAT family protein [Bacteroidia bacterium]